MNVWIGGTFLSTGRWAWIDGQHWTGYTNWMSGEPNNFGGNSQTRKENKIMMLGRKRGAGLWNDAPDSNPLRFVNGFICEHRA